MRSIIEAIDAQQIDATVSAVISNRPDAAGLDYAKAQSITTAVVDHKTFSDRDSFDKALAERIDDYKPDFVILAGFMRILTSG
ncbi:phosphoribosylglycinamide formyltransferase, partial [Methylophaga sp. UBA3996]